MSNTSPELQARVQAASEHLKQVRAEMGRVMSMMENLPINVMFADRDLKLRYMNPASTQTLKQIEQYQTQLQQYENMLQNTMAPAAYIWDQAQSTINGLMAATDTRRPNSSRVRSSTARSRSSAPSPTASMRPIPLVRCCNRLRWWMIRTGRGRFLISMGFRMWKPRCWWWKSITNGS